MVTRNREHFVRPSTVAQRLDELDREWDLDRCLQASAAGLSLAGLALTILRGRFWLLLPAAVQAFFLQHTVQGWSPPVTLLRRLGVRTREEIEEERRRLLGEEDREPSVYTERTVAHGNGNGNGNGHHAPARAKRSSRSRSRRRRR